MITNTCEKKKKVGLYHPLGIGPGSIANITTGAPLPLPGPRTGGLYRGPEDTHIGPSTGLGAARATNNPVNGDNIVRTMIPGDWVNREPAWRRLVATMAGIGNLTTASRHASPGFYTLFM